MTGQPGQSERAVQPERAVHWGAADLADLLGQHRPTPEQAAVIETRDPAQLVVAGAGSGKTETMAARVVWLVANRLVRSDQVLGLTFTRKAAAELSERLAARLDALVRAGVLAAEELQPPVVSTYNAWSGGIVAEHGLRLGIEPGARVLSAVEAWQGVTDLVTTWPGELPPGLTSIEGAVQGVLTLAGQMGDHLVSGEQVERELDRLDELLGTVAPNRSGRPYADVLKAQATLAVRRALVPMVQRWQELKAERQVLEFSDQTQLSARLARGHAAVGRVERARSRAVLLDEFQDTTEAQLSVVRGVFAGDPTLSVTAVGDPHQSIYGFRGASARTMESFVESFDATERHLSTSWRNSGRVLRVANRVAEPLRERSALDLPALRPRPGSDDGPPVTATRFQTPADEARAGAAWLAEHWAPGELGAAVLCRKRSQFPVVTEALEAAGLPYEVVGLGGLLLVPEVADVRALLGVVDDPTRGDHLMRLLTGPAARLGAADLVGLHAWRRELERRWGVHSPGDEGPAERRDHQQLAVTLLDAVLTPVEAGWTGPQGEAVSDLARARLASLAEAVTQCLGAQHRGVGELALVAEQALGVDVELASRTDVPPWRARAHLEAFHEHVATFAEAGTREPSLSALMGWLSAAEQHEGALEPGAVEVDPSAVQVLTVHASKGLEWDAVWVPGLVAGTFPSGTGTVRPEGSEWVARPATDSAWWAPATGMLPFALRGDAPSLPEWSLPADPDKADLEAAMKDFARANGERGLQEERRLAYVAVTRARRLLHLSSAVWGTSAAPTPTSDFLLEVLDDCALGTWVEMPPTDPVPENPVTATPRTALWPRPEAEDLEHHAHAAAAAEVGLALETAPGSEPGWTGLAEDSREHLLRFRQDVRLLLAERDAADQPDIEPLRHVSTSSLVALARDPGARRFLARPVPTPPARAARQGTDFHAWVESQWAPARLFDVPDLPQESQGEWDAHEEPDAQEEWAAPGAPQDGPALDGPRLRTRAPGEADLRRFQEHFLASEWAGRTPTWVELPLQTSVAGLTVRGRADAIFPATRAERDAGLEWVVVDWKTSSSPREAEVGAAAVQLACYRQAFAAWRGIDPATVGGAFFHAADGVTVRPELPDGERLEQLVRLLGEPPA
ncbi:UvrD-helicase domain-containing protein [Kytococcus sedentarius]|uniref:UvrD-helicase domain-containing protein n=1 Tax=Kytococcus sedentarius TaxID=1276 RepID=UPI00387A4721